MKKVSSLLTGVLLLLAYGCKKDDGGAQSTTNTPVTVTSTAWVKNAEPNTSGLQGKFTLSNGTQVFRHGLFDTAGNPSMASFLTVESPESTDSLAVVLLNENGDLAYMYNALKATGEKSKNLIEFLPISDSQLIVNWYVYDWQTSDAILVRAVSQTITPDKKLVSEKLAGKFAGKQKLERLTSLLSRQQQMAWGGNALSCKVGLKSTMSARGAWNFLKALVEGGIGAGAVWGGYGIAAGAAATSAPVLGALAGIAVIGLGGMIIADAVLNAHITAVDEINLTTNNDPSLDPSPYSYQQNSVPGATNSLPETFQPVSVSNATLSFYDFGAIDGDIIQVSVNGNPVGSYTLTAAAQTVSIPLHEAANTVIITPLSEGSQYPCTTSMTLAAGSQSETHTVNGYLGTSTTMTILKN